MESTEDNSKYLIREAIRKIALGRSLERINMAPGGMSGIGTARLIHGYVAKIHDDQSDEEYARYGGTVDVGEYPDETASTEHIIHKGVLLTASSSSDESFVVVPTMFSDVTIALDAATKNAYVVNYSRAEIIGLTSRTKTIIGVTETEELDTSSDSSADYDELEATGNSSSTVYTPENAVTTVTDNDGNEAVITVGSDSIEQKTGNSSFLLTGDKVQEKVGSTTVTLQNGKVTLGDENASEPLVLGNQLAQLMLDFLTECSKITTVTMLGTMPVMNIPNFVSLTTKIRNFLSQTSFTK